MVYVKLTDAFAVIMSYAQAPQFDIFMPILQRLVNIMWDRTSTAKGGRRSKVVAVCRKGQANTCRRYSTNRSCFFYNMRRGLYIKVY